MIEKTPSSFAMTESELTTLNLWLWDAGYIRKNGNVPAELDRYKNSAGSLIVFYRSGTVLIQGKEKEQTIEQIKQLLQ